MNNFYIRLGFIAFACLHRIESSAVKSDVPVIASQQVSSQEHFARMSQWIRACKELPQNRKGAQRTDSAFKVIDGTVGAAAAEMEKVVTSWLTMMSHRLLQVACWQDRAMPSHDGLMCATNNAHNPFVPFVQKMVAPTGTQFYVHGDLHGDIHSLVAMLDLLKQQGVLDDTFRIIPDNVYFLFLGDYVDRGFYGSEVIYTLLRLSLVNQDRVILVRGNHEDPNENITGGFAIEMFKKFGGNKGLNDQVFSIYNYMPVALYVGTQDATENLNYIQCCHGGLETGYNPGVFLDALDSRYQLITKLDQKSFARKCCDHVEVQNPPKAGMLYCWDTFVKQWWSPVLVQALLDGSQPMAPENMGFMWNDFDVKNAKQVDYLYGRGWIYGKNATQVILSMQSGHHSTIRGVIRAHQHGDVAMMEKLVESRGVYKMWCPVESATESIDRYFDDGQVWTFNVGPDSTFGRKHDFGWDAYAKITVQKEYADWTMRVFNQEIVT